MIYLAAIYVLTLVGFGLLTRSLLDERGRAEVAWREERSGLLQRIQAPDTAVIQHYNEQQPPSVPRAVNEFDDDDYWASKDELAEIAAREEVNGGG